MRYGSRKYERKHSQHKYVTVDKEFVSYEQEGIWPFSDGL
jgi:hypothetical protein